MRKALQDGLGAPLKWLLNIRESRMRQALAVLGIVGAVLPLIISLGTEPAVVPDGWMADLSGGGVLLLDGPSPHQLWMEDDAVFVERTWRWVSVGVIGPIAGLLVWVGLFVLVATEGLWALGMSLALMGSGVGLLAVVTQEQRHVVSVEGVSSHYSYGAGAIGWPTGTLDRPTAVDWDVERECTRTDEGEVCASFAVVSVQGERRTVALVELPHSAGYRGGFDALQELAARRLADGLRVHLQLASED